ncbi:MAG: fatty acid desaturase [Planctomycetes bacterium]|nr:fatty acid desaturase [Planctomycetota bacterium]
MTGLELRDATASPTTGVRALDALVARLLCDPRDAPLLGVVVGMSLVLVPGALVLYAPGGFSWPLAAAYLAALFGLFFDRYILMLHATRHRRLFRPGLELDAWVDWALGPLAGQSPCTYHAHHLGMHHVENNLWADASSTLPYRRDSALDFLRYWGRFLVAGVVDLVAYLLGRRRTKLARRAALGELAYLATLGALLWVEWRATLVVFVVPLVAARFAMMAGNWAQHAFVDPADPGNPYRNSLTTINTRYNRRCFNDGYHIGHHLKPSRHWSELPGELLEHLDTYRDQGALVLEGLDFFQVWALLMVKDHDTLARHVVHLGGAPRSHDETVALLRARLVAVPEPVVVPVAVAVAA